MLKPRSRPLLRRLTFETNTAEVDSQKQIEQSCCVPSQNILGESHINNFYLGDLQCAARAAILTTDIKDPLIR